MQNIESIKWQINSLAKKQNKQVSMAIDKQKVVTMQNDKCPQLYLLLKPDCFKQSGIFKIHDK